MIVTTVHAQHFDLTPSIKRFALETLRDPLDQIWRKDGAELDIELRDVRGGDKQGVDKECRCVFYMPNGPKLVITEVTEDMRKSIHQARKRLMRRVRQYVEQKVKGSRKPTKYYLASVASKEVMSRMPRAESVHGAREVLS